MFKNEALSILTFQPIWQSLEGGEKETDESNFHHSRQKQQNQVLIGS